MREQLCAVSSCGGLGVFCLCCRGTSPGTLWEQTPCLLWRQTGHIKPRQSRWLLRAVCGRAGTALPFAGAMAGTVVAAALHGRVGRLRAAATPSWVRGWQTHLPAREHHGHGDACRTILNITILANSISEVGSRYLAQRDVERPVEQLLISAMPLAQSLQSHQARPGIACCWEQDGPEQVKRSVSYGSAGAR